MQIKPYIVYVQVDDDNRITAVASSALLTDTNGWTQIDSGYSYRHHHAQNNYLPGPLEDKRGICRYKLVNGAVAPRTQEEMDADYAARPAPEPTTEERVAQLEAQNETLLGCLLEMSEIVYA